MIIVITGPTAVGKTKLSIEIAKKLNGEIINADSTQIYKDLDIATAKVNQQEMGEIKHHLINIKNIEDDYTLFDYQRDCRLKIKEIATKGKIPIIVGGTGLYIKAALYDYELREESNSKKNYDNYTNLELYQKLLKIDSNSPIHQNNRKRIIRALNYYDEHQTLLTENKKGNNLKYKALFIGLTTDRKTLYKRINERVDIMMNNGLILEAKKLYNLNIQTKAIMTPIGYKELFEYFDGHKTLEEAIALIKQRSRRYAKRQYTWFNNKMQIKWFDTDFDNFDNTVNAVLDYIKSNS